MQFTVKSNIADGIRKKVEAQVKTKVERQLQDMANIAINQSPVYSGSYVNSWSFKANNTRSRGRRKKSTWNKSPSPLSEKSQGLSNLYSDIANILTLGTELEKVTIRNDAAHSRFVEEGIQSPKGGPKRPYQIFRQLRAKYG